MCAKARAQPSLLYLKSLLLHKMSEKLSNKQTKKHSRKKKKREEKVFLVRCSVTVEVSCFVQLQEKAG